MYYYVRRITPMTIRMAMRTTSTPSPRRRPPLQVRQPRRQRGHPSTSTMTTRTREPTIVVLELSTTSTKRKTIIRRCLLTAFTSGSRSALARASKRPGATCSSMIKTGRVSDASDRRVHLDSLSSYIFIGGKNVRAVKRIKRAVCKGPRFLVIDLCKCT